MQVCPSGRQAERIDREVAMGEPNPPGAAAEQGRELLIAAAEIEDGGHGVVLLRMRHEEVQEEGLPGPGRTGDQGVPNIMDVQVPEVRGVMLRLEGGEILG